MRLSRIVLDAWGHYRRQASLSLPAGAPDLHVIVGANEAGKSTLLAGLEALLFGFERKTPYGHQHGDAALALSGEAMLADGRALSWTRRKKGEAFSGLLDGRALDEAGLRAALGGVDRVRWRGLFGFSDAQLARAAEALTDVPLAQVAAGEADPRAVRAELERVATGLFSRSKNARNPKVNTVAAELARLRAEADAAAVLPARWAELEAREADTAAALARAEAASEAARGALARAQARLEAHGPQREAQEARVELERLAVPPSMGRHSRVEHERQLELHRERAAARDRLADDLRQMESERATLQVRGDLLEAAEAIERLARAREGWEREQQRLPGEEQALAAELRAVAQEVADLLPEAAGVGSAPEALAEALASVRCDAVSRENVRALAEERAGLERERDRLAHEERELERRAAALAQARGALPPEEDLSVLAAAAAAAEKAEPTRAERRALSEQLAEAERAERALAARVAALRSPEAGPTETGGGPDLARLPDDAALSAAEEERGELIRRLGEAEGRAARAADEVHQIRLQVAGTEAEGELPTEGGLAERRRARADAWAGVRRAWLGGEARSGLDAAAMAQRFEGLVDDADRYADARFAAAQRLSARAALDARLAGAEAWASRCGEEAAAAQAAREEWGARWADRWAQVGLPALGARTPAEARVAVREVAAWAAAHERTEGLRGRVARLDAELSTVDAALAEALAPVAGPAVAAQTAPARLDLARAHLGRAREAATARARLVTDEARLQADRAERAGRVEDHAAARAELESRWSAQRAALGVPAEVLPAQAAAWLDAVRAAGERLARARRSAGTLAERRRGMEAWATEVDDTLPRLLGEPRGRAPGALCERAARELAEARRAADRARALEQRIPETVRRLEDATTRLDEVARALAAAREAGGAPDDVRFLELARAAERAFQLRERLQTLEARLEVLRGREDPATFAAAAEAPPEALESAVSAARAAVSAADQAREDATRAHHEARLARLAVDGSARAAALRQEAEGRRRELRERVEEWATLALALRLLDEATRRFEQEREPDVLARTSEWLRALTHGRYVEVRSQGAAHLLEAVRATGEALAPDHLSEGTRQQLYLAARLAWAERHNEGSEPLPLVLDDALAAFDDARARAAIEVLATVGARSQVLLLTHHAHVVELAREVLPGLRPLRLGEDGAAAGG